MDLREVWKKSHSLKVDQEVRSIDSALVISGLALGLF